MPSALYSFSFEPNQYWSRVLAPREELWEYLNRVANKYELVSKMSFDVNVDSCEWIEERSRWRLRIRHFRTDSVYFHTCQFLFAGGGIFVRPREIDVPGKETFRGPIIHSAHWPENLDLADKNVVFIGNGCTAAQIVPSIVTETKHLTQIVRSKHWVLPPIDSEAVKTLRWLLTYVPGATTIQRFVVFAVAESELRGLRLTRAAALFRRGRRAMAERYMRATAPAEYHDILIPDFEVGCKRRIFDSGYLQSLHSENLTLTEKKALEIMPDGVRTSDGIIPADVIVLATGFTRNNFLDRLEVIGRGGVSVKQHWEQFPGPEAYNCSAISGFPNFFILVGTCLFHS